MTQTPFVEFDRLRPGEGVSEADRVEREMAVIARCLWAGMFPGQPVPPDDEMGRRELIRRALGRILGGERNRRQECGQCNQADDQRC